MSDYHPSSIPYADRTEAGQRLVADLRHLSDRDDLLILGLPRGGVVVAHEIATALPAPMDVMVVRKLGLPKQPELAMGAIATGGARYLNADVVEQFRVPEEVVQRVTMREMAELRRREQIYRKGRSASLIKGRTVVLVDDGIATGSTMRAAIRGIEQQQPTRTIVAVPVGPLSTINELQNMVDEVVCPAKPRAFHAVGQWYEDFPQVTDEYVCALLTTAWRRQAASIRG